jgi:anti-sigma-K factor RskA
MVQAWLDRHPDDAALVQGHRNLLRLWRETAPVEPSEKVWRDVLEQIAGQGSRIEVATPQSTGASADVSGSSWRGHGRWVGTALLAAAAAAAVVLVLFAPHKERIPLLPEEGLVELGNELSILGPEDVNLVSLEAADSRLLVVGDPPLQERESLILVAMGDVTNVDIKPDKNGFAPQAHLNPQSSAVPMIIAPIGGSGKKDSAGK